MFTFFAVATLLGLLLVAIPALMIEVRDELARRRRWCGMSGAARRLGTSQQER